MKHEFNQNILGTRLSPPTPHDLAARIIANAQQGGQNAGIWMMLILPRPYLVLSALFIVSFFAGIGMDFGFNSIEAMTVNEQDILYAVDNSYYVETL